MKKFICLSFLASLLLSSCNYETAEYKALQQKNDSLMRVNSLKDKEVSDYLTIINEVEQNLEKIKVAQERTTFYSDSESTPDIRTRIQNDLDLINKLLEENKEKLAQLESKEKQLGSLRGTVAALRKRVEEKEAEILELQNQLKDRDGKIKKLDSTLVVLNEDMMNLATAKQRVDEVAIEQDASLHTGYYFFGTSKDLKNSGITIKKNGLNINKARFTQIDIRDVTSFDLDAKSAIVLTAHPGGSYKINIVDKKAYLEIIDPAEFWSISKYLVVRTK